MKKIISYIFLFCAPVLFTSCTSDNDSEGLSSITNYPVFTLEGENTIILEKGEEYVEPGASALEAGEPVEVTSNISAGLFRGQPFDPNIEDIYTVTYSAINVDGFEGNASRTVIVVGDGDLETNLSGLYRSTIVRNGSTGPQYTNIEYVLIWENSPGVFEISDAIGGYYHYGRGYGPAYAATGYTVTVNGVNNFTFGPPIGVGAFGGVLIMKEFTTDASAGTIDFITDWDLGYVFEVHLEKVQL